MINLIKEEKTESYTILSILKEHGFRFLYLEGVAFISCPNPDFQPDNGLNPFLACTLEELFGAIKNDSTS